MSTTTEARTPTHIYPAIMADDVAATRDFYVSILGFGVIFDSFTAMAASQHPARHQPSTSLGSAPLPATPWRRPTPLLGSGLR